MKRFIFSRFGLFNFDPKWYEDRFAMFETFCLPSIEKMKCDELYWMIVIPDFMPFEFKRRLYSIVDKSIIRANIYVIEFQGLHWTKNDYSDFIAKHANSEELVMMSNLDLDDALAPSFFDVAQKHIEEKNLRYNYIWLLNGLKLLTYEGTIQKFYDRANDKMLHEQYPLSMAYIFVCKCSQIKDFIQNHTLICKDAGDILERIYTPDPMYLYTRSGINNVVVNENVKAPTGYKEYDTAKVCAEITFLEKAKLDAFNKIHKDFILPNEILIYHNYLMKRHNWLLGEVKRSKEQFAESINITQLDKSSVYLLLTSHQKEDNTFLDACYQEYEKTAPPVHDLQKHTDVDKYLNALHDFAKQGGVVAIATCAKPCLKKLQTVFKDIIDIPENNLNTIFAVLTEKKFLLQGKETVRKLFAFNNSHKGTSLVQLVSDESHAYIATNNFQHYSLDDPGINIVTLVGENGEYQVVDTVNICDDILNRKKRRI